jgi:FkbM family methyltransferase
MAITGQLLRLPLRLVPKRAVLRILSGPARGMRWIAGASNHGCWLGSYERDTQAKLGALIRPGDTVLDVGAHVGFYTLLASRLVGDGCVIAFEPFPRNLQYLERHVRMNRLANVEIKRVALGDHTATGALFVGHEHSSGSLVPKDQGLTAHSVLVVALDDWRASGQLPHVDVIKMDIEGAEGRAILGMRKVLASDHPRLYIALHGGPDQAEMVALLTTLGYAIETPNGEPVDIASELIAR